LLFSFCEEGGETELREDASKLNYPRTTDSPPGKHKAHQTHRRVLLCYSHPHPWPLDEKTPTDKLVMGVVKNLV
jgi:hypothetical protein